MQRKATNLKFESIIFATYLIVLTLQLHIDKFYFTNLIGLINDILEPEPKGKKVSIQYTKLRFCKKA
jgi:hypothetical protein